MAKNKKKKDDDDDIKDDDRDEKDDKEEDLEKPSKYRARNDAYTGMLAISLLALIGGCALLFLDYQKYEYQSKPPKVQHVVPVSGDPEAGDGGANPAPQPNPAGGAPVNPPAGGGNPAPMPGMPGN